MTWQISVKKKAEDLDLAIFEYEVTMTVKCDCDDENKVAAAVNYADYSKSAKENGFEEFDVLNVSITPEDPR